MYHSRWITAMTLVWVAACGRWSEGQIPGPAVAGLHGPNCAGQCNVAGGCCPSQPYGFTVTRWKRWPGEEAASKQVPGSGLPKTTPPKQGEELRIREKRDAASSASGSEGASAAPSMPDPAGLPAAEPPPTSEPRLPAEDSVPSLPEATSEAPSQPGDSITDDMFSPPGESGDTSPLPEVTPDRPSAGEEEPTVPEALEPAPPADSPLEDLLPPSDDSGEIDSLEGLGGIFTNPADEVDPSVRPNAHADLPVHVVPAPQVASSAEIRPASPVVAQSTVNQRQGASRAAPSSRSQLFQAQASRAPLSQAQASQAQASRTPASVVRAEIQLASAAEPVAHRHNPLRLRTLRDGASDPATNLAVDSEPEFASDTIESPAVAQSPDLEPQPEPEPTPLPTAASPLESPRRKHNPLRRS